MTSELTTLQQLVSDAQHIVIMQADNPDGDSLGSTLALEAMLSTLGKEVSMYCAVDMPGYLKYLGGWSRVERDLPPRFDLSIIVDASTTSLFDKAGEHLFSELKKSPLIVLDHHTATSNDIDSQLIINEPTRSSTAELIYTIARELKWTIPADAFEPLMTGILGDTQGLSNQLASAETYHIMAELITQGADRPSLEEKRRLYNKMPVEIYRYKATLIGRTEFGGEGRVAIVTIPQAEIVTYSPLYNPGPLIQTDMLQIEGVLVGLVLKNYDDGHLTGMIRCNNGAEIAAKLAEEFGGGGHAYAAGFKINDGRSLNEVIPQLLAKATELLDTLK